MRIVLLGPPGSGTAELSEIIAKHYELPIVTQASVVNTAANEQSELGRLAAEARDASRVSDELLLALLRIQLPRMDLGNGYILVDMPKNSGQADVLDSVLNDLGKPIDLVLNLEVDTDDLMERLVGHIQCDSCGAAYNMYVNPPMVDNVCDECGARVCCRPDDYEETISNRLRIYEGQIAPLLQYYRLEQKLRDVEATAGVDVAWKAVRPIIDETPSPEVEPITRDAESEPAEEAKPAKKPAKNKAVRKKSAKKKAAKKKAVEKEAVTKPADAKPAKSKSADKKTSDKKSSDKKASKKKVTKKKLVKKAATKKVAAKKTVAKKVASGKSVKKKTAKKVAKKVSKKTTKKAAVSKKKVVSKKVASKGAKKKVASKKVTKKKVAKKKTGKK